MMHVPPPIARLFTLENEAGMRLTISEHGASMVSWLAPDREGRLADVLLGYPDSLGYADNPALFGAVIGRWANRIACGRFALDGALLQVDVNDRGNHLHGASAGFHARRWHGSAGADGVRMELTALDGEGGFPGNLQVQVHYRLTPDGSLWVDFEAEADAPTPLNLTVHPYFNLSGGAAGIAGHQLQIDATYYLATDAAGIPVGAMPVAGGAFDLRAPARIGQRLQLDDPQLSAAGGFDHCFCIAAREDGQPGPLRTVARAFDPDSGRCLDVSTTQPGLQFCSGNGLAGVEGRAPAPYARHAGFCLAAQAFPDQLNGRHAQAAILRPGAVYRHTTVYRLHLPSQGGAGLSAFTH